jgi:uncharacterized protein (DUF2336 family)
MSGLIAGLLSLGRSVVGRPVDYENAKRKAADADPDIRRSLARQANVQPEILYYLAEDPDPAIRREIAANPGTPVQADELLAADGDETVRCHVARKVARLAPDLTAEQQQKAGEIVAGILDRLAHDETVRVREVLSEELRSARNVPQGVIETLARDAELSVSGPILENSPLLSDAFLIDLIASGPVTEALQSIAGRNGLSADVADAIVDSNRTDAITSLLRNKSAQIRETTLDAIVAGAVDVEDWHAPLVERPSLSRGSAAVLSRFVADALVEKLLDRPEIDPEMRAVIAKNVRKRLSPEDADAAEDGRETAGERAERLFRSGALDETEIHGAIDRGERSFIIEAISLLGGLNRAAVQKAFALASAKGVAAVAWKAGLSAETAHHIQLRVARIPPAEAVKPSGGDYPMSEKDIGWQLEFLGA